MKDNPPNKKHLLTVLVEDYFHVGAFDNLIQQKQWVRFEPRYEQNTLKALDLLDQFKTKATFFVLGWIAEQNPDLVREIVHRGHEVASRGFYHRSLKYLTPDEFREDLKRTNDILQTVSNQKVHGYRSAEKISYASDQWVLDILAEEGMKYDASFLPVSKDEKWRRFAHQHSTNGREIWELPYSTLNLGGYLLPISGGNYFRQIPYTLLRHAVRDWNDRYDEPFVMYFHVWELDPDQPRINAASPYNRLRHYRKLDKMEWVIKEYMAAYDFSSAADILNLETQSHETQSQGASSLIAEVSDSALEAKTPVTVVIPCYNESESLPYLANTLRSVETDLSKNSRPSFIFVDDCSKDDTLSKLQQLFGHKENVKILKHEKNQGVAAGIMTGLAAAETEIVCSMDCDCTYDPHELVNMIPLLSEDAAMVTASPYHPRGGVRNVPGWRLFLSKGASFLYSRVLKAKLYTYTSCFRVYRKSAVLPIETQEKGFLGVAEMLGKLDLDGGKIIEYPAELEVRLFGFSKMKTLRTIVGHLKLLSRLALLRRSKRLAESLKPKEITEKSVKSLTK